jgi:hypothetical protein
MKMIYHICLFVVIYLLSNHHVYADQSEFSAHLNFSTWQYQTNIHKQKIQGYFQGTDLQFGLGISPNFTVLSQSHYSQKNDLLLTGGEDWQWQGQLFHQSVLLQYKPSDQITPLFALGAGVSHEDIQAWRTIKANGQIYRGESKSQASWQPQILVNVGIEWRFLSQMSSQFVLQSLYAQELSYGLFINFGIYRYFDWI